MLFFERYHPGVYPLLSDIKTCFSSVRASFPLGIRSEYMKGSRRENNGIQGRRSYIHTGQGPSCPRWIKEVKAVCFIKKASQTQECRNYEDRLDGAGRGY